MKINKRLSWLFLATVAVGFTSCEKEKEVEQQTVETLANAIDTTTVGKLKILNPKVSNQATAMFTWSVNGVAAGTDSILTFKPTVRGDYVINYRALTNAIAVSGAYKIHVYDKYENGFFLINEGWYGHGTGTVGFYRYDTKLMEDTVFVKENPGKTLEPKSSTLQSGVSFNDKLYLVSKVGGPMVVVDRFTLKETARIAAMAGNDWRSFVGISATKGYLSAQSGLFPLDLTTLVRGAKLAAVTGQIGDLLKAGNYIFALSASKGILVIDVTTDAVVKTISGALVGFTQTPDGSIWAAGGTKLFKINPTTLDVETITVPFPVYGSWAAWHPGSITASTKENAVFLARNGTWMGGKEVYKYIPGNAASLTTPFITLPAGKELYGSAVAYDKKTDQLILNTVQSGFGQNYQFNNMYFHKASTGALVNTYSYEGFHFPSIIVFQP